MMNLEETLEEFRKIAHNYRWLLLPNGGRLRAMSPSGKCHLCPITALYHHKTGITVYPLQYMGASEILEISRMATGAIVNAADGVENKTRRTLKTICGIDA